MIAVALSDISFAHPESAPLYEHLSLTIDQGECVALCGPSGCGKSTLCHLVTGIIPRNLPGDISGDIRLFDRPLPTLSLLETIQTIGIVFQNPDAQLFSPTVEDEIAFGPENLCLPRKEIGQRIDYALATVGMQAYRTHNPNDLSGGQKQLIALAAVLALRPRIIVFDEALSQLDDEASERILDAMRTLKAQGHTLLMVEHDEENLHIADRILRLERGHLSEVSHADASS